MTVMNPNLRYFYAKFLADFESSARIMSGSMDDLDYYWLFGFIRAYVKESSFIRTHIKESK